jgi:hypothetical protein
MKFEHAQNLHNIFISLFSYISIFLIYHTCKYIINCMYLILTDRNCTIANSHALQFSTARAKSCQSAVCTSIFSVSVFTFISAGDCLTTH